MSATDSGPREKLWANEAHDLYEQKKCKEAFDQLAEQINGLESEAFTRELRKLTGPEAQQCASGAIDGWTTAGKFFPLSLLRRTSICSRTSAGASASRAAAGSSPNSIGHM